MLSYRHGFHAGNSADVLKHSCLVFCLDYLLLKDKPLFCIDTHAGAGAYALDRGFAAQNREWENGIGRLSGDSSGAPDNKPALPDGKPALPELVRRYLELVQGRGPYPGSPALIRALLKGRDLCSCFELHPADFAELSALLDSDRRFTLYNSDGLAGLKALLPPPSRRALVFIDPSYEIKDDYETIPERLEEALRRFSTGTYIIWYPLLSALRESETFPETLMNLYSGNRCRLELYTAGEHSPRGLYGSGLIIYNPPWTLRENLETSLPFLAERLGTGKDAFMFTWENGDAT
jgi:23S rRNA (adenine2030-N6)-methyltransferase